MVASELDENLPSWDDVREQRDWPALLLGNGFSQNVWGRFSYASLYDTATSDLIRHGLTPEDTRLFDQLHTRNFEMVLSDLRTGMTLLSALGRDATFLEERYGSIRGALIEAVHHVHVPWQSLPATTLANIAEQLAQFETVYSSNYDLLTYWALMKEPTQFKDYFWPKQFEISNTEIWGKCTKVHFLHGGLHLYRKASGQTIKRTAHPGQNLLDLFRDPYDEAVPLLISEGTADEKRASISRSDYLSFVFSQFARDVGPVVVFGQSLSKSDDHLVKVLDAKKGRSIAISIRGAAPYRRRKAELIAALPKADIMFFDAATHPLGAADLKVDDAGHSCPNTRFETVAE